jgi:large subunit ribosomal protein L41
MEPTRSKYVNPVSRGRKTVQTELGFQGKDYLQMWATDNYAEVEVIERLEQQTNAAPRQKEEGAGQKSKQLSEQ